MGYTTDFSGGFKFSEHLTSKQITEFNGFCGKRHSRRREDGPGASDNIEASYAPSLHCDWETDGVGMFWSGAEKAYSMTEWGNVLLEKFLKPWGITIIDGEMNAQGESRGDIWKMVFRDGKFLKVQARIVFEEV